MLFNLVPYIEKFFYKIPIYQGEPSTMEWAATGGTELSVPGDIQVDSGCHQPGMP